MACDKMGKRFNTQPPEGGWARWNGSDWDIIVSTHSRLKAAGPTRTAGKNRMAVSTHSRLKAAGYQPDYSNS